MERSEKPVTISRRELLIDITTGVGGSAMFGLGIIDRNSTPLPGNISPQDNARVISFNLINRLRSTLLIGIGAALVLASGATYMTSKIAEKRA